jgi:glutamyl/glutaminyl-tRNA synthetase
MKQLPIEITSEKILAEFSESLRAKAESNQDVFQKIIPIILDHTSTFGEVRAFAEAGEYGYFFDEPEYSIDSLLWKDEKDKFKAEEKLRKVLLLIEDIDEELFTPETIKAALWDYATGVGRGSVLWPMRYALSGRDKSPDPFLLSSILGKETTMHRISAAIKLLLA